MKKVFNVFKIKEQDNVPTAMAKGGANGIIQGVTILGAVFGTLAIVGKMMSDKEIVSQEMIEDVIEDVKEVI